MSTPTEVPGVRNDTGPFVQAQAFKSRSQDYLPQIAFIFCDISVNAVA